MTDTATNAVEDSIAAMVGASFEAETDSSPEPTVLDESVEKFDFDADFRHG